MRQRALAVSVLCLALHGVPARGQVQALNIAARQAPTAGPQAGLVPSSVASLGASLEIPSAAFGRPGSRPARTPLKIDGLYFETAAGRTRLPAALTAPLATGAATSSEMTMPDGRVVRLSFAPDGRHRTLRLGASPDRDVRGWGLAIDATPDEYYTGLMERVVDGPQQASWAPGITAAMNLRGQRVEMIVKPTTSLYAPFYLSSRAYGVFVKGTWPGRFDFCANQPDRVTIDFEGPSIDIKIYLEPDPAAVVRDHALDAGPPLLPPKWTFTPWRWRDEHSQLPQYYDGTAVTGPFNSQVMEDVLLMQAYGIPNGVYWIDRPWGPGPLGYDDFEIDSKRLPHFAEMVKWLDARNAHLLLWIAPWFQGQMERDAVAKGYQVPGQPTKYVHADFTNPAARAFWQAGLSKLLTLGVAAFKLDRGEEDMPEQGPFTVFDGRSVREQRNDYPVMFLRAAYEEAKKHRGDDFLLMPRGAYTGSARYGAFWGGDIGGTQEGLRASIIAVQRAAVMGYPLWGSDTCGYNEQLMEQEVCARWLAFSAFTPIMEVGPTRNVGFWNLPRVPSYDDVLIATWRLYARVHQRLVDYSYRHAREAADTGMPIVRPLMLAEPGAAEAWTNWGTYLYGTDLLVSPVWEKGRREAAVYLPSGSRWRDAWRRDRVYDGGRTVTVPAEVHQIPLFVREGSGLDLGDLNREYRGVTGGRAPATGSRESRCRSRRVVRGPRDGKAVGGPGVRSAMQRVSRGVVTILSFFVAGAAGAAEHLALDVYMGGGGHSLKASQAQHIVDFSNDVFFGTPLEADVRAQLTTDPYLDARTYDTYYGGLASMMPWLDTMARVRMSPPLQERTPKSVDAGGVVAVRFSLMDAEGNRFPDASPRVYLAPISEGRLTKEVAAASRRGDNLCRYDRRTGLYALDLDTKGLAAGTYRVRIDVGDYTTTMTLR